MDAGFQIPIKEEMIGPVCEFTYSWGLNCGLSKGDALRFSVAVSELITDIILFAYPDNLSETFAIEFQHTFSNVEVVVCEMGEPFDPDQHLYNAQTALRDDNFEGAGFRLIRAFCDDFIFINKGKEGKEFRLFKNIRIHSIDELLQQPVEERNYGTVKSEIPDKPGSIGEFVVKQIRPDDAEDISKLIYRTYHYTYFKDEMYLPKKIEEAVLDREKLGVIARLDDGDAIGYFGVIRHDDSDIAEVGEAVVSPGYRRNGVMSSMLDKLIQILKSREVKVLIGMAVTNHLISQKVNHKFGFKTTAIKLATSSNMKYKGFDQERRQPMSVALDYLPLIKLPQKRVYLPGKYQGIILETYSNLGIGAVQGEVSNYRLQGRSQIDLKINNSTSTSLMIIHRYGSDFLSVLTEMVNSLTKKGMQTIYLDLPLENVATPGQFLEIDKLEFIYSGLLPLYHRNADYLRMQMVLTTLDTDKIQVFSDFGKKIKAIVTDEYNRHT